MTIKKLFEEYDFDRKAFENLAFISELIHLYAEYAICEDCSLFRQCPVRYEDALTCAYYLEKTLEIEK